MKYKSFTIENYKGIKDITLDLNRSNLYCFIGINESGKTTLLDAIKTWWLLCNGGKLYPITNLLMFVQNCTTLNTCNLIHICNHANSIQHRSKNQSDKIP